MNEEAALLDWFPIPRAFLIDVRRINVNDWLASFERPGTVIRVDGMDGPPIIPIRDASQKFYPIEDEL